jgi:hypothetical protein
VRDGGRRDLRKRGRGSFRQTPPVLARAGHGVQEGPAGARDGRGQESEVRGQRSEVRQAGSFRQTPPCLHGRVIAFLTCPPAREGRRTARRRRCACRRAGCRRKSGPVSPVAPPGFCPLLYYPIRLRQQKNLRGGPEGRARGPRRSTWNAGCSATPAQGGGSDGDRSAEIASIVQGMHLDPRRRLLVELASSPRRGDSVRGLRRRRRVPRGTAGASRAGRRRGVPRGTAAFPALARCTASPRPTSRPGGRAARGVFGDSVIAPNGGTRCAGCGVTLVLCVVTLDRPAEPRASPPTGRRDARLFPRSPQFFDCPRAPFRIDPGGRPGARGPSTRPRPSSETSPPATRSRSWS